MIKGAYLSALRLAVAVPHGEVPLARAVAERLAVPGPPLPRGHLPLRRADVAGAEHLAPEPDALQDAEAPRVRVQVLQHLVVAREEALGRGGVRRRRPREVGEPVRGRRRLQPRRGERPPPHAADTGGALEDHGAEPLGEGVLACRQAARAGADDRHAFLRCLHLFFFFLLATRVSRV